MEGSGRGNSLDNSLDNGLRSGRDNDLDNGLGLNEDCKRNSANLELPRVGPDKRSVGKDCGNRAKKLAEGRRGGFRNRRLGAQWPNREPDLVFSLIGAHAGASTKRARGGKWARNGRGHGAPR